MLRFGTDVQKEKWLKPLMNGSIRSAFAMTEPAVASSDATNITASARYTDDCTELVINGHKWWCSGVMDPRCSVLFVLVKGPLPKDRIPSKHEQHSIIIVPRKSKGVTIVRPLRVFGYDDAPHGHGEVTFTDVMIPSRDAFILRPGAGFEAAQSRLGGGRLHHCMRLMGVGERALELLIDRAETRVAFGRRFVALGGMVDVIAQSRIDIESCRLLVCRAADAVDSGDKEAARRWVAMAKIAVPKTVCNIIDRAIQVHGGGGLSDDFVLAQLYAQARALRIADGPDEVHSANLSKLELRLRRQRKKLARL